ncbi:MAG TPA: bifunctional nuclease domain-containing protein [Myxococcales bacterium]
MGQPKTSFVALVLAACAAGAVCGWLRPASPDAPVELVVSELVHVRGGQMVLVLEEKRGGRRLPVPVSKAEAVQLDSARGGRGKLLPVALEALGGRVLSASLDDVAGGGLSAHLTLSTGSREVRVEAPAGEAVALALTAGAPILVDPSLLELAGVSVGELQGKSARTLRHARPEAPVLGI